MKIRGSFVPNSSASSFSILKIGLSEYQKNQIYNHIETAEQMTKLGLNVDFGYVSEDERWSVSETEEYVLVSTGMDNFDMHEFLKVIGVDESNILYDVD